MKPGPSAPGARDVGRWLASVVAVLALQALSWLVAPAVVLPSVAATVVVFALVAGGILLVGAAVPPLRLRSLAWLVVPALGLLAVASVDRDPDALAAAAIVAASLLAGGTLVGGVIGSRIEHASHLLVVAYVSSLADVFSVFSDRGVSAQVVQSERLLAVMAISWPVPGGPMLPVLGVGDVIMCALYLAAARHLELGLGRMVAALAVGFAAVLAGLFLLQIPLPALPALGLAAVLANPPTWRMRRHERLKAVAGMVLITLLFAALSL